MLLSKEEVDMKDKCYTSLSNLGNKEFHLRVATKRYEKIVVQLADVPGLDYLLKLFKKCTKFEVYFEDKNVNLNVVKFLCLLYPEKSSKVRQAYMTKHSIREALNE